MKREVLKGHLDLLLLATLQKEAVHGYAIIDALRQRSDGELDLAEGTVYPALHRLEHEGLIKSRWTSPPKGERRRRLYELTRDGRSALDAERRDWRAFYRTINLVLEGSRG